jgi:hypothetical protein
MKEFLEGSKLIMTVIGLVITTIITIFGFVIVDKLESYESLIEANNQVQNAKIDASLYKMRVIVEETIVQEIVRNENILTNFQFREMLKSEIADLQDWIVVTNKEERRAYEKDKRVAKKKLEVVSFEDENGEMYWIITKFDNGKYIEMKRIKQ